MYLWFVLLSSRVKSFFFFLNFFVCGAVLCQLCLGSKYLGRELSFNLMPSQGRYKNILAHLLARQLIHSYIKIQKFCFFFRSDVFILMVAPFLLMFFFFKVVIQAHMLFRCWEHSRVSVISVHACSGTILMGNSLCTAILSMHPTMSIKHSACNRLAF